MLPLPLLLPLLPPPLLAWAAAAAAAASFIALEFEFVLDVDDERRADGCALLHGVSTWINLALAR